MLGYGFNESAHVTTEEGNSWTHLASCQYIDKHWLENFVIIIMNKKIWALIEYSCQNLRQYNTNLDLIKTHHFAPNFVTNNMWIFLSILNLN